MRDNKEKSDQSTQSTQSTQSAQSVQSTQKPVSPTHSSSSVTQPATFPETLTQPAGFVTVGLFPPPSSLLPPTLRVDTPLTESSSSLGS